MEINLETPLFLCASTLKICNVVNVYICDGLKIFLRKVQCNEDNGQEFNRKIVLFV